MYLLLQGLTEGLSEIDGGVHPPLHVCLLKTYSGASKGFSHLGRPFTVGTASAPFPSNPNPCLGSPTSLLEACGAAVKL